MSASRSVTGTSVRPRRWVVGTVVAVATGLLAGCVQRTDGAAVPAPSADGATIAFGACGENPHLPDGTQCGTLAVPIDYARPDGDVAELAVLRIPATAERLGSLVINPGGPGASGVEAAVGLYPTMTEELRRRFDLVGFDPRGVGASTPAIRCNSDADIDRDRARDRVDYSPAGVAAMDADTDAYIARCIDKTGENLLANVGTVNVARDLDRLRAALGDDRLTYLGFSYGTAIGTAYAEQFPDRVRAMVLDGAIDPDTDPMAQQLRQAQAFQQAFDDFARDCAAVGDCALGDDPAGAVAAFKGLVDPLVGNPVPTGDGRSLSYSDALTGTTSALYSRQLWPYLRRGLAALRDGGPPNDMMVLADLYLRRSPDGRYANLYDAFTAVTCVDDAWPRDRAAWVESDRRNREVQPISAYGPFTGNAPIGVCGRWPVEPTGRAHRASAPGLPTVLVVSTTNDPATPYEAGVSLAEQLGAVLLTYEGTQHLATFQSDACIDDTVTAYLVDLVLPPSGVRCR